MDHRLSPPGNPAVPCSVDELAGDGPAIGTAKSIGAAAVKAGYDVRAVRSTDGGPFAFGGRMHGWAFHARWAPSTEWYVTLHRPGWPDLVSDVVSLRAVLKSQTPVVVRKTRRAQAA